MAIMRRDVNLGLLLVIVAAILMFSGFTVYYQTTFKNVSKSYDIKLKELDVISKDLESKKGQLNQTNIQLTLQGQKEQDLSKKYVDTKSERDQLETDKNKLTADLSSTKSELAATLSKLVDTQNQLAAQAVLVQQLNSQVLNLKSDVNRLDDQVEDLKKRNACLKSTAGASETC